MTHESQKLAVNALRDWSQWLIGIDVAAVAGCVIVLQGGVDGAARAFLVVAIAAFAASVLCAVLLVQALASVVERLPLADADGKPTSVADHPLRYGIAIRHLARTQLLLMVAGGISFLGWVVL